MSLRGLEMGEGWERCFQCQEELLIGALEEGLCSRCRNSVAPEPPKPHETLRAYGVPPRHTWAGGLELSPPELLGWCGDPWAVIFQGPNGSGKTSMATRLFLEAAQIIGVMYPKWVAAKSLAAELRSSVRSGEGSPSTALAKCGLLLIDDFRAARETDFISDEFEYILTERDNHMRPTILTMDRPLSGLDGRIESRLSAPYALPIVLDDPDWRKSDGGVHAKKGESD